MSKPWLLLRSRSSALVLALAIPVIAAAQLTMGVEKAVATPDAVALARATDVDIASDGGTMLVVWTDRRTDMGGDVFGTLLDRNGRVLVANIPLAVTAGQSEADPGVEWDGSRYQVIWFDGTNTLGAEVSNAGTVITSGRVLWTGRPTTLSRGPRETIVAVTDATGTTIGAFRPGVEFIEGPRVRSTQQTRVLRLESGYMIFFVDTVQNRAVLRAIRLDGRGRTIDTPNLAVLGSFATDVTLAASVENDVPILVAAARDRMVVARVDLSGGVTALTTIESIANRRVEDVLARPGGFDIVAIIDGLPRILSYTADALSGESNPLPGPANAGAATLTPGRMFTVWTIDGMVTGRFAFSSADPAVLISMSAPNQQMPALATDGAAIASVWVEDVTETTDRIMSRVLTRDGTPTGGGAVTVATRTMAPGSSAPAAAYHANNYYVAWVDAKNGLDKPAQLNLRTLDRAGLGGGSISVTSTAHPTDAPALAAGPTDVLLVWSKAEPSPRLRAVLVSDTGRQIEIEDLLAEPAVAYGAGAYVIAGRTTTGSVRTLRLLPNGTIGATLSDTGGVSDGNPSIATNGSDFLVTFERAGAVHAQFVNTGLQLPVAPTGTSPRVTWDGEAYVVAWSDGGDVFATRVHTPGVVETAVVLSATALNEDYPALLGLGGGATLAAYQRMVPELHNVQRVFTRVLTAAKPEPKKPGRRRSVR